MRRIELTAAELNTVLEIQNGKIKPPFHIVRSIERDDPLWRSINEDHTTQWRCDGIWSWQDDGDDHYYLERLDNQGNPTEKYEHVAKCLFGNPGDKFRANFIIFEIVSITVTRLHHAISCPSVEDSMRWSDKWEQNPFAWKVSIRKVDE
jgi:hypothetical protein